jgi:isopentenyl diphosphate isomerase/L-lactate dehydrogenase-like FMN-dependent dehydrogenase
LSRVASRIESVEDARYFAERRLPGFLYQNYEAGSGLNLTLGASVKAFEEVLFKPRTAVFNAGRDLHTRVLGHDITMPVMLAPVGALRMGHPDGEVGVARAAGRAGTIQIVSTATGTSIEEICAAATGPVFYQLYFVGGRSSAEEMIDRAAKSGCKALVVSVDTPSGGFRERLVSERAYVPTSPSLVEGIRILPQLATRPSWFVRFLADGMPTRLPMGPLRAGRRPYVLDFFAAVFDEAPAWSDIPWIRSLWKGPLVIKGILNPEDARLAVDAGADAIVVSNHGGNGLDGTMPSLRVLPGIVDAVGDQTEVWLDSGIRRGSDVVKAVALGARTVLIGRAYVFALMAAGEAGVSRMLELFRTGIDSTLSLLGCPSVDALGREYVSVPSSWS